MSENKKIKIMSKKLFSISLACVMLVFAACKKNNKDVPVPPTVVPKVKAYTISDGATVLNTVALEYDNTGRRTKLTYADGSWVDFTSAYKRSIFHTIIIPYSVERMSIISLLRSGNFICIVCIMIYCGAI